MLHVMLGLVIERAVLFGRRRSMRCGSCQLEWLVDDEWLDRFDQGYEVCPECGADCQGEDRPDFWVLRSDPAHEDSVVRGMYWYHTSTHANWPDRNFDPVAGFHSFLMHLGRFESGFGLVRQLVSFHPLESGR